MYVEYGIRNVHVIWNMKNLTWSVRSLDSRCVHSEFNHTIYILNSYDIYILYEFKVICEKSTNHIFWLHMTYTLNSYDICMLNSYASHRSPWIHITYISYEFNRVRITLNLWDFDRYMYLHNLSFSGLRVNKMMMIITSCHSPKSL